MIDFTLQPLLQKQEELTNKLNKLNEAIYKLQTICKHDFEKSGNDSHYYYETCKLCGLKIKI